MIEKKGKRFLWIAVIGFFGGIGYLTANLWGEVWKAMNIQLIGKVWKPTDIQFGFENYIPFIPEAIFAYLLVYPFLLISVFLIKKYSDFMLVAGTYAVLIFVSLVIFFQFPTTMARPVAPVHGLAGWLLGMIRAVDGPNNLLPSLHVSSAVFMALVNGFFCPKVKGLSWVCAALIGASTLLVKQHAVVDVLGGMVIGASAYVLLRVLRR